MASTNRRFNSKGAILLESLGNSTNPRRQLKRTKTFTHSDLLTQLDKLVDTCNGFEGSVNQARKNVKNQSLNTNPLNHPHSLSFKNFRPKQPLAFSSSRPQLPEAISSKEPKEKLLIPGELERVPVLRHSRTLNIHKMKESEDMEGCREKLKVEWQKQRIFKSIFNKGKLTAE